MTTTTHTTHATCLMPAADADAGPTQWEVGIQWEVGDRCILDGIEYECVIPHTSLGTHMAPDVYQAGWSPV